MSTGNLLVNIVNGQRKPFDAATRLLVTAIDGRQKDVRRTFVEPGKPIQFSDLKIHDNPADRYSILVAAKGHSDAGFNPVTVKANADQTLELMMLRREAEFVFADFDDVERQPDLHALLCGDKPADARALYEGLVKDHRHALACLLNITTALDHMTLAPAEGLDQNPLRSFKALHSPPQQDRVFAWADARLLAQVRDTAARKGENALSRLAKAPAGLHPGATDSYKQIDFGEGNVQLSFHEGEQQPINGGACMLVEADIDYFQDTAAHILLEVFPNKLKSLVHGKDSAKALTDPRTAYGLRWIAGRRLGREFAPPYVLN